MSALPQYMTVDEIRREYQDSTARSLPERPLSPVECCRCNQPAWVMVRCARERYAAFLCANDLATIVAYFAERHEPYTIDRLTHSDRALVWIDGIDVIVYVRAMFDGVIGDAGPFDDEHTARLAVEAQLYERMGRHLDAAERIVVATAVSVEWQRRDRRAREEAAHRNSDWLFEFQAGGRS